MNKQEAIEKIKNIDTLNINDKIAGQKVDMVIKTQVLSLIEQIDEPKKVTIQKFVADFYESIKDDFESKVYGLCLQFNRDSVELSSELCEWFDCGKPFQTLVEMKLYGYEVVQEKLYTVEIPDPNSYYDYRYLSRNDNGIYLDASDNTKWKQEERNQLTEAEIKQDFEWAFQFAKPVEDK